MNNENCTVSNYDHVAIVLHWITGLIILVMLATGFFLENLPESLRGHAFTLHKSLGITVLALSVLRLIWRFLNPPPALPSGMRPWEKLAAHAVHWALYFLIIAMPLSGWLMVSASRKYPTNYFWLTEVPFIPMPAGADPKIAREFFGESHELFAIGAIVLVAIHIGAALKHQFVTKDNLLDRMKLKCPNSCRKG